LHLESIGLILKWQRKSTNIFGHFAKFAIFKSLPAGRVKSVNTSNGTGMGPW
jgi:hypothetical protein